MKQSLLIFDHLDDYIVFTIQHGTTSIKAPTHRKMRDFREQNISNLRRKKIQHGTNFMLYFLHKIHTVCVQTTLIIIFKGVSQLKTS